MVGSLGIWRKRYWQAGFYPAGLECYQPPQPEPAVPSVMLPQSFLVMVRRLRPVFTGPSFANLVVLVAGFVHALGGHRITDALRAAGPVAAKHYTTYYRFFSHARWSLDELGITLIELIVELLGLEDVELVLDDTLAHRTGKKVALAGMHADPLLKKKSRGRLFVSYGHVFVVLSVHIRIPTLGRTGWALPVMFRLFEAPSQGGRDDSPSDVRRRNERRKHEKSTRRRERMTDREVVDGEVRSCRRRPDDGPLPENVRPKKTTLGAELVVLVAKRFPHLQFRVLADHLYNGRSVLHAVLSQVDNVHIVTRGRPDAALYEMPPPRQPGEMGRPRTKGERLPNPQAWAEAHPEAFREIIVEIYGRTVTLLAASFLGMAYRSLPGRLLRYVIVKDPSGVYRTDFIISTDTRLDEAAVIAAYARRWPLERMFQDCKQKLCIENTQTQLPASVRRSVPFGMVIYTLVVLWYVTDGHVEAAAMAPRLSDPWYARTARPSFSEMLAALRRIGWAQRLLDPPSGDPPEPEVWANYFARVVAAA